MKLPVFKAVGMTFAFVLQHWLDLLKIVWLPLALLGGVSLFVLPGYMQSMVSLTDVGAQPSPEEAMRMMSSVLPIAFGMMLAGVAVYMIVFAGVLKLVIRGDKPSLPFYLGFGSDEWRLLGTWLLVVLILIGVEIVAGIVAAIVGGVAAAVPGAGVFVLLVAFAAVFVAMAWVCVRLSLATPAAVGAQTIGIGPSWNASKGNAWALFFYWLIWTLLLAIVEVILLSILMPGYFQAMGEVFAAAGRGSPEEAQAAMQAMNQQMATMYDTTSVTAIVRLVAGFVIGGIVIIIMAVAGGVAWRLITEVKPETHFE